MVDTSPVPNVTRRLIEARRRITRFTPLQVAAAIRDGALVVDTRPMHVRRETGHIPQAIVIERNVLEWRLDPTSPWRIPQLDHVPRLVIIVCHEGYASSLAAAALRDLGLDDVGDMVGGMLAWVQAGLPLSHVPADDLSDPPEHSNGEPTART